MTLKPGELRGIVERVVWHQKKWGLIAEIEDTIQLIHALVEQLMINMKTEWNYFHNCAHHADWGNNPSQSHCALPQHDWTDDDWRIKTIASLGLDGVWPIK